MATLPHRDPAAPVAEPKRPKNRVLLVSGSPRRGGNTDTILRMCATVLAEGSIPTETVRLCDIKINPCTGCELCRKSGTCSRFSDGMNELYPTIEECRGLIIASPTYNYTVTPEVKAFIDRYYPYFEFTEPRPGPYRPRLAGQERLMIPIGICEQNEASEMRYTIPVMRDALEVIGYETVTEIAVTGHFYAGTVADDEVVLQRITEGMTEMATRLGVGESAADRTAGSDR
ncbi:MAG: flavodoxin family protein [Alkalispirochaeta sp.]